MSVAAAVMGLCVRWSLGELALLLPAGKAGEVLALGLCAALGAALYFVLALILGVDEAGLCVSLVKKTLKRG